MQLSTTMILMMYLSVMSPFTQSILPLGALLLSMAMLMTLVTSQVASSWYAFILFLVYITGLLVLFSYMMAMSPNSYYSQKEKIKLAMVTLISATLFTMTTMMTPVPTLNTMEGSKEFEKGVTTISNLNNTPMYWTMGVILLIALLMAVTICHKSAKPLRAYIL